MTDYRQKYENERTARKLAEKENELLKKEIELLKMELKQAGRNRSPTISQESESEQSSQSSNSETSESEEEITKPTRPLRKKPQKSKSSHEVIIKPVEYTLKQIIDDAIEDMEMSDFIKYGDSMEVNSQYEINFFESIINNVPSKQVPILMTADGKYNVFDEDTKTGERKWIECDLNKLVDKTFGRIHNSILKQFNKKGDMVNISRKTDINQTSLLTTLNMLCKIETEKLLKPRSRALAKMFKN